MRIGIFVSDSGPMSSDLQKIAVDFLRDNGHDCIIDARVHSAKTAQEKANIINTYYSDPNIDILMPFWGGLKTIEILPYLNWSAMKQSPKPIIGYSDTTALLQAVSSMNLPAIHGPALITFVKKVYRENALKSLEDAVTSKRFKINPTISYNPVSEITKTPKNIPTKMSFYNAPADAKGRSIGGNLQTLLLLNGTEYQMRLMDRVLFIEEAEEANEDYFRRYLSQLIMMPDFKNLAGLVISHFTDISKVTVSQLSQILDDYNLKSAKFPIIQGFLSGHCDPILSVPLNVDCTISMDNNGPIIEFGEKTYE